MNVLYPGMCTCPQDYKNNIQLMYMLFPENIYKGVLSCSICRIMWFVHVYKIIQLQDLITQLMHKMYPVVGTCTQDYSADARVVSSCVYMYTRL